MNYFYLPCTRRDNTHYVNLWSYLSGTLLAKGQAKENNKGVWKYRYPAMDQNKINKIFTITCMYNIDMKSVCTPKNNISYAAVIK